MIAQTKQEVARRLALSMQMFGVGLELVRERLRREHPRASPAYIESEVRRWVRGDPP